MSTHSVFINHTVKQAKRNNPQKGRYTRREDTYRAEIE